VKKFLLTVALAFALITQGWAATSVTYPFPGAILLVPGASPTDYSSTSKFPNGIKLTAIVVSGLGATDVIKMRHGSLTGGFLPPIQLTSGGTARLPFGGKHLIKPFLEVDDQTWASPASISIWLLHDTAPFE
jgi:hypothetical protein